MIKNFQEFEMINEGWKGDLAALFWLILSVSTSLNSDQRNIVTREYVENYIKTMNIANQDTLVREVIKDFKDYVKQNPQILNKQEVYNKIDNTPIVYRKDDKVCREIYRIAKENSPEGDPSSWCSNLKDGRSVIFLNKDAKYNQIFHELSHAIEPIVKIDPNILQNFNFNISQSQVDFMYMMMTNFNYQLKTNLTNRKSYLSDPSEVWARINNLKMYLYKHKYLKTPYENFSEDILWEVLSGNLYKSLSDKEKKDFSDADFIDILVFVDLNKFKEIKIKKENMEKIYKMKNVINNAISKEDKLRFLQEPKY